MKEKRKARRRWFMGIGILLAVLGAADYWLYPVLAPVGGRSFNTGENGLWLRYTWYFGEEKEDARSLAARLKQQQIRYAYFHVRFIRKDGALAFRHPEVKNLLTRVRGHLNDPSVKLLAWIYVGNERGLTGVDIADTKVRRNMVREAKWLAETCGFDGVQWDYEICEDGNQPHLRLLRETRSALAPGKLLSVSTAMWLPRAFSHWGWSDEYFARVAAICDQVVVMGYYSGLYWPRHYVWLMRRQVTHVTAAAARSNPRCRVLIGMPTYEDGGPSHHRHAENIRMALKGVREGGAETGASRAALAGVAIFADYSNDAQEWQTYRRLWLRY
jgi:hypothetical protein